MANPELFLQTAFIDGISEDDRVAGANHYLYWEGIDVITEPDFIQLTNWPELSASVNDNIFQFAEVHDRQSNQTTVIAFGEDAIYHADSSTPVYTSNHLNKLDKPVFVLDDHIYWVVDNWPTSNFTLDRTTLDDADSSTWSPNVTFKTLNQNAYFDYSSVLVVDKQAYIALGNVITILGADGSVFEFTAVTDEIVGMANSYAGIMIFTDTGKMVLWSGGETQNIKSSIQLNIKPTHVYQYGGQILMLWGGRRGRKWLYQFTGTTAVPMYLSKFSSQADIWKNWFTNRFEAQCVTNNRDNFYFIDDQEWDDRVIFLGNGISWLRKGIHYPIAVNSSGDRFWQIRSIFFSEWDLYLSWSWWGRHGIDKVSNQTGLISSGFIITNVKDYGVGIVRKNHLGVYFRVKDVDATHTIQVTASQDGEDYELIKTINSMPENGIVRIVKQDLVNAGITWDFEDISFRFDLTTDNNRSPKIYKGYAHKYEVTNII